MCIMVKTPLMSPHCTDDHSTAKQIDIPSTHVIQRFLHPAMLCKDQENANHSNHDFSGAPLAFI